MGARGAETPSPKYCLTGRYCSYYYPAHEVDVLVLSLPVDAAHENPESLPAL
jgi:hypothetical protein